MADTTQTTGPRHAKEGAPSTVSTPYKARHAKKDDPAGQIVAHRGGTTHAAEVAEHIPAQAS